MIKMVTGVLVLSIQTKSSISILNSNHTMPTGFFLFLISLTSKLPLRSLLPAPQNGKPFFPTSSQTMIKTQSPQVSLSSIRNYISH